MKPGHKDHAVKYATIDSSGRFVATSGTDGKINIYEISNFEGKFIREFSLFKLNKNILQKSEFEFRLEWLGETLLTSG